MSAIPTRDGNLSSSSAWRIMGAKKVFETYIREKNFERKAGRSFSSEASSRPTEWGKYLENYVFENPLLINTSYRNVSKIRITNTYLSYHNGCPDLLSDNCESDIKCPFSLGVFFDKVECLESGIETYKKEYPEDYWQHVSNSILAKVKYAEAIIFVPYRSELEAIRAGVDKYAHANKIQWIKYADDAELPYLIEGMGYKNINKFRFEVPEADKILLIDKIKEAGKLLIEPFTIKQEAA